MTEAPECRECFDYGCQIYDHELDATRTRAAALAALIARHRDEYAQLLAEAEQQLEDA